MIRGEISNEAPPRWMVTLEVLTSGRVLPKKRAWKSWEKIAQETPLHRLVSGMLMQATDRVPAIFEAVTFGLPDEYTEALFERLEYEGWPIRYVTPYADRDTLASALAYMPHVRGVIDLPGNTLTWGSRGWSIEEILRG